MFHCCWGESVTAVMMTEHLYAVMVVFKCILLFVMLFYLFILSVITGGGKLLCT